ncbi:MAG TPA: glycosyltransferase family 2 protein [Pseudonocardiaceae bacterium]|jgi:glycosyltransferase involved in cell wall biosynthesis|nr:glycosyltransferase family 2 protein [Pseudonocardiaceae bacterium]
MTGLLASVVIPAHNEQHVIGRCLRALTDGAADGELDVIVVANACDDDTAGVARSLGALVIETAEPGKANALNLGDARCRTFPRLYLDADIEISAAGVRDLVKALTAAGVLACAPAPQVDISHVGRPVRRFHTVLERLRGDRAAGLSGAGAYLLGEPAHRRVFPMPSRLIADDALVHRTFTEAERAVVDLVSVTIRPPRTVSALIRRRARVRIGNQQLAALGVPATEASLGMRKLFGLVRRKQVRWSDAGCFAAIVLTERAVTSARKLRRGNPAWSADRTTRS